MWCPCNKITTLNLHHIHPLKILHKLPQIINPKPQNSSHPISPLLGPQLHPDNPLFPDPKLRRFIKGTKIKPLSINFFLIPIILSVIA